MATPTIFARLCDLFDELMRIEHRLAHSSEQLALAELIDRFDALIDDTIGLEVALELDLPTEVQREDGRWCKGK